MIALYTGTQLEEIERLKEAIDGFVEHLREASSSIDGKTLCRVMQLEFLAIDDRSLSITYDSISSCCIPAMWNPF